MASRSSNFFSMSRTRLVLVFASKFFVRSVGAFVFDDSGNAVGIFVPE